MFKKCLLLMMLMALFAPWAANAQATLTVHDGTSTSRYVPFYGYYADEDQTNQMIYPADELADMAGGTISAMMFYWTIGQSNGGNGVGTWTISIGETEATSLSGLDNTTTLTEVFTGSLDVLFISDNTLPITFDNAYSYNGGNLLVQFSHEAGNYKDYAFLGETVTGASYCYGSQRNFLPKTTFTYEVASTGCNMPTSIAVSDIGAHQATVTWEGEGSTWNLRYKTSTETEYTLVEGITENPYTLSGLEDNANYSVGVQTDCGGTTSGFRSTSFSTPIACPAPTNLAVTLTLGDGTVATLSWTENGTATEWDIEYGTDAAFESFQTANVSGTPSTILNALTPETTYYARVKTYCGVEGYSLYSNTVTFTPTNAYTLTVNDGTNTHSYVPFYGYYADSDANSQFIIPASALSSMAWGTINKITFYGSTASATWNGAVFDIYFSEVSNTEFESTALVDWSDLDSKVYTGSVSVVDNKMELTLTAPYQYMGGNLLIGFDETTNSSNYPQMSWYGVTQTTNTAVYKYSSNAANLVQFLPKITFNYIPGEAPACLKPTMVTATEVTAHEATIAWTSDASAWTVAYKTANATEFTEVYNVTENPYTLTGLDAETTYQVRVQTKCNDELYSVFSDIVNFTTAETCPDGMVCIGTGTSTNSYLPTYTYYKYSLTQQIYTAAEIGEAGAIISVDFYKSGTNASSARNLDIYMVNTEKEAFSGSSDWIAVTSDDLVFSGNVTFASDDWTTIEFDNPFIYDGNSNMALIVVDQTGTYVTAPGFYAFDTPNQAIRVYNDSNAYDPTDPSSYTGTVLSQKNRVRFAMGEMPACIKPTGLTVNYTGGTTAEVTWNGNANLYNIEINGEVIEGVTTPYQLTNLDLATIYEMRVQADCGGGLYSVYTDFVSFITDLCLAENQCDLIFELTDSYGDGWNGAYIDVVDVATGESLAHMSNQNVAKGDPETETYTLAVCDGRELQFVWHSGNYDGECSFVIKDSNEEEIVSGVVSALPFNYTVSCTTFACPKPIDLVCTAVTPTTATLSWTETGDATSWDIQYSTDPGFGEYTSVQVDGTPSVVFENLTPETIHYARVRAFCEGGDDMSAFSNVLSFEPTEKIVIGSGDGTSNYLPTYVFHQYSLTQQIYTAEELGEAGAIMSIDFYYVEGTNNTGYRNFDIYMVSTEKEAFSYAGNWIHVTDSDLVFSGEVTLVAGTWSTIVLDKPFIYDGTSNVAIMIDDNSGNYWISAVFKTFNTASNQAMRASSDYYNYGPQELPVQDAVLQGVKNQIRILKSNCITPTDLTANMQDYNAYTISWVGASESYNLRYRTAETIEADFVDNFENGMFNWNVIDADGDGYGWVLATESAGIYHQNGVDLTGYGHNGSNDFLLSASYSNITGALTPDNYLVSPMLELGKTFSFWAQAQDNGYPAEHFGVAVSTTVNNDPDAFTMVQEWTMTAKATGVKANPGTTRSGNREQGNWYQYTVDLSDYAGQTGYIAIRHFGCMDQFILNLDDITYGDVTITPAGDWITIEGIGGSEYSLADLEESTIYEFQVQGIGDDDETSEWSTSCFFTTVADEPIAVLDGGYWNEPETWVNNNEQVPNPEQSVTVVGDVIIGADLTVTGDITIAEGASLVVENGVTFNAGNIIVSSPDQLIIAEGASFTHTGEVLATMVLGYNAANAKDGESEYGEYRLIASPVTPYVTVNSTGLVPNINDTLVDLYYFDQAAGDLVWINYKDVDNHFVTLDIAKGYLYANAQNVMGLFAGNTLPTNENVTVDLDYTEGNTWAGWNLVGNPYTCLAYINRPYYKIDGSGMAIAYIEGNSLEVFEGVFVKAEESGQTVTFRTTDGGECGGDPIGADPEGIEKGNLVLNLSHNNALIDRAIVRFDEGRQLPKLQLNPNSTEVYIPMDGVDYAIVNTSEMGEMPVSFKAERNDTYTMSFTAKNVGFNYLHLIDNITGADVDLLVNPSYSFKANTTDYANRFKLVFATGNNSNDNFAFFSNGNFVISNEGEATLQVIDVTGRIIKSETINGSASVSVNAATGVYMLRLINGNDVKVQKVVVR